jgi:hypothetical protein
VSFSKDYYQIALHMLLGKMENKEMIPSEFDKTRNQKK